MIPGFSLIPPLISLEPVTYIGNVTSLVASFSPTFSSVPIGAADANRRVILTVHTQQASVTAVTIGGISAVIHASSAISSCDTTIVSAVVPTGNTATVVVSKNSFSGATSLGVFSVLGSSAVPTDTDTSISTISDLSSSVSFSPVGLTGVVAISFLNSTNTVTWANADEVYEIAVADSPSMRFSAAIVRPEVATVTATKSISERDAMAGAVWS